ncbi:protein Mdm4 isoform X2 [Heterodontus francisci]|uniref:protein Mdm4 isoform X2 n=1 Tax=Heterodontus francisci TaxID=7792 RepID=UPI00355B5D2D
MTTASTSKPYTSSDNPCSVSAEKVGQIRPKTPLLNILHEAGASGENFTLKEVMHYLGQYIMLKQLYDQQQQHIVHCGNDALGKVFGVQSFSVKDPSQLYEMLSKNLMTANFQGSELLPVEREGRWNARFLKAMICTGLQLALFFRLVEDFKNVKFVKWIFVMLPWY